MADFLNKFKKTLDKGVNTVSIKSNILMEVNRVKSSINALNQDVQKQKNDLSDLFYKMYLQGSINIEACKTFCLKIQELEAEIKIKENEIEDIRQKEELLLQEASKKREIKEEVHFPITPQVSPVSQSESIKISKEVIEEEKEAEENNKKVCSCGQVIDAGAKFCSGCGMKID